MSERPSFTIGIEEEYMTIDPETRELRSHIDAEILEKGKLLLRERVKPEMHQCVVEVGTDICHTIQEARAELKQSIRDQIKTGKIADVDAKHSVSMPVHGTSEPTFREAREMLA